MTIVIVPPYPQRNSPTFADEADSWNAQLPTWTDQVNATAVTVSSNATTATTQAIIATTQSGIATTQAGIATTQADIATNAATTAINSPGTMATSTTSNSIGLGGKTFTIELNKLFVVGQFVQITSVADISNYMVGQITAYNSGTGALTVNVSTINGAGTFANWRITQSSAVLSVENIKTSVPVTIPIASGGLPLAIKADGTAELVTGSKILENELINSYAIKTNIDSTTSITIEDQKKIVVFYRDASSPNYGYSVVGTISEDKTVSFGIPQVFYPFNSLYLSAGYDPINQKIFITWVDASNGNIGKCRVGEISGDSIIWGSEVTFEATSINEYLSCCFDTNLQKVVICYGLTSNAYGKSIIGTIAGNEISFGTSVTFNAASTSYQNSIYDPINQKIVIAYRNAGSSNNDTAIIGTVSGTSISFGTPVVFDVIGNYNKLSYDSFNQKVIACYYHPNDIKLYAIAGTVSGTSISFGTKTIINSIAADTISISSNASGQSLIVDRDSSTFGAGYIISVSGSAITLNSSFVFCSEAMSRPSSSFYIDGDFFNVFHYGGRSGVLSLISIQSITTNADKFIGFSDAASIDGVCNVNTIGFIDDNQTGLTSGLDYYIKYDGTFLTDESSVDVFAKAGKAISATKIIVGA